MRLFNTREREEHVSLEHAVFNGLAPNGGLYLPREWPRFPESLVKELLRDDFITRSVRIAQHLLGDEFTKEQIATIVSNTLTFPVPLVHIQKNQFALELFHGPTLAFKDFGARFLAQMMLALRKRNSSSKSSQLCTILTATSGDTGAAVADAFHNLDGFSVRILYPKGKISPLQEKMFCALGDNIKTYAVQGSFDDCQSLVKQCFEDTSLRQRQGLTSANSINIARLLGQVFYYFEAAASSPHPNPVLAVPSGNFGNLTAGIMARSLGAPIKRFIAATNSNDTIPRFLKNGLMEPRPTVATLSNAMDVSKPNNWERINTLFDGKLENIKNTVTAVSVDEQKTISTLRSLRQKGYLACPHTTVALQALSEEMKGDEAVGIALATAHPAKFQETLQDILTETVELPPRLEQARTAKVLSESLPNSLAALKSRLC
jgi:threonine synthase